MPCARIPPLPQPLAERGFSLVEIQAVLAIAAVLLGIGVPSMRALAGSMGTASASNELLADLFLARSEAIKRKGRVTLCKSGDGVACTAAGAWDQGWIVFVDDDGDGWRIASELVLQRQPALGNDLRVRGNASLARYVSYASNGSTRQAGGGFQAGTMTVCQASLRPATASLIVINANGRPRVQKALVDSCG
jgi:type IV fimbrial biogenesis protein FimT